MKRIRLGIVGLGHVASYQLQALAGLEDYYEVTAVCDTEPTKAGSVSDAPFFNDLPDFVGEARVDAVLVSVPNAQHASVCQAIMKAGLPVLVEKPATTTVAEFDVLMELADSRGTVLHTAYHAAFARELQWYAAQHDLQASLGALTGFRCGFYDPYIVSGQLLETALSLQGSWVDSGINALSVMRRLVPSLCVTDFRRTRVEGLPCREVQASMDLALSVGPSGHGSNGLIDTNWTLGRNRKSTWLFYGQTDTAILLDHTAQRAILFSDRGEDVLVEFNDGVARLVAHYVGVFKDFHAVLEGGNDNRSLTRELLRLLYYPDT
jgi:predicted dehydrogenase